MTGRSGLLPLVGLVMLSACPRRGPDRPTVLQFGPYRAVQLHDPALLGVSGLAEEKGELLVVTESSHRFIRLRSTSDGAYEIAADKPVSGVDTRRDLESIARLGPGRYVLGTEDEGPRKKDRIYFAEESDQVLTSTRSVKLKVKKLFGMRVKDNQGVEGLCSTAGHLIAAIETVHKSEAGDRLAPIAVLAPGAEQFAPVWLRLTTETGKISSLSCRLTEAGLEVLAIERHYGVLQLIRAVIPTAPNGEVIEARAFLEMNSVYRSLGEPNFEGLERLDDGTLVLVSDNDHGGRSGPTVLLFIPKEVYAKAP